MREDRILIPVNCSEGLPMENGRYLTDQGEAVFDKATPDKNFNEWFPISDHYEVDEEFNFSPKYWWKELKDQIVTSVQACQLLDSRMQLAFATCKTVEEVKKVWEESFDIKPVAHPELIK